MKIWKSAILGALMLQGLASGAKAQEFYLGQVITVGFNFCPRGTAEAAGQLLPIDQYTALFSLLGTIYGGDGRTTFALPDLRGRVVMGPGTGPGLPGYSQGQTGVGGVAPGNQFGFVAMKACVVTEGIYPSRS